jgi:hypothetical protein
MPGKTKTKRMGKRMTTFSVQRAVLRMIRTLPLESTMVEIGLPFSYMWWLLVNDGLNVWRN